MFFRKLRNNVLKNRIEQLERENKRLKRKLRDERELSGTYRIKINEQDDKINKLELQLYNSRNLNELINTLIIDNSKSNAKIEVNDDQIN